MMSIAWAVLRRTGQAVVSLLVVLLFVFSLLRVAGNPINFLISPRHSPEQRAARIEELGLNDPWPEQLLGYIGILLKGDWGYSWRLELDVIDLVASRILATAQMAGAALLITVVIALPLGVYSAYHRTGIIDRVARFLAAFGQAVPQFWVGIMLILFFSINLGWLPSGGYGTVWHLILPAATLAIEPTARVTRLLRSSMIEALGSDYVRFHRIKGLPERTVLWKQALRNAGLTTLTFLGVMLASLFTGSVLVEAVFAWPGMGRLLMEAIGFRDFPVIQGVMLMMALGYISINLIVDLLYMVLNPRLRVQQ